MIHRPNCFSQLCHEDGVCHVSPHPPYYTAEDIMTHPLRFKTRLPAGERPYL